MQSSDCAMEKCFVAREIREQVDSHLPHRHLCHLQHVGEGSFKSLELCIRSVVQSCPMLVLIEFQFPYFQSQRRHSHYPHLRISIKVLNSLALLQ